MSEDLGAMLREFTKQYPEKMKTTNITTEKSKKVFGTKEWSKFSENILTGCSHDCKYCYAKANAIRFKRITDDAWKNEILKKHSLKSFRKRDGRFMFPTTHDITPQHLDSCKTYLASILLPGNEVLVVSKPHLDCIKAICDEFSGFKNQILFRLTIGSSDSDTLKFWEPNAPDFQERLESLKYAYTHGYQTSVSCEPILDNNAEHLVEQLLPYVTNSIWFGKPNSLIERLSINGFKDDQETMTRARNLLSSLSDDYIRHLYSRFKDNPKIKWKESIKKVLGLEVSTEAGIDE